MSTAKRTRRGIFRKEATMKSYMKQNGMRLAFGALLLVACAFGVIEPTSAVMGGAILMAAHATAESHTDTIYAISAALPVSYDSSGYGSTSAMVFTVIGRVSDFPLTGAKRAETLFTPIAGAIEKVYGSANYGGGAMIMADVPADAGQVILAAAALVPNTPYSLKETMPDGEIYYYEVHVGGWERSAAKEGQIVTRTATLGINRVPVRVPAS